MEPISLRFATTARVLAEVARAQGVEPPAYRTPPRRPGVARSLRRHPQGTVVSVQVRGRPWLAVVADMIDGLVAANRLAGSAADACRTAVWAAVEQRGLAAPGPDEGSRNAAPSPAGADQAAA